MKCPNCSGEIGRFELSPNCKHCGVNIYYSQQKKFLTDDAKMCELEYASFHILVAKLKAAFVRGALPRLRIVAMVVAIASIFVPFATVSTQLPLISSELSFGAWGIYSAFSDGTLFAMLDLYKYARIYSQAEEFTPFKTIVFATYPPTQGIEELEIDDNINFHPDFFYTKNLKAAEIIKTIKDKNNNGEELTDNEAIDLILTPDTTHNIEIKELMETTTDLLANAVISDKKFHLDLIKCQRKMLKRFFKKDERNEMEKMLNFLHKL